MDDELIRLRILAWQRRVPAWKRWLLWRLLGRDFCPRCQRETRWRFWCWSPIHPDGLPLFTEWHCRACGFGTGIEPSEPLARAIERRMEGRP